MRASRAGVTQLAECLLPKQNVAGSNPVSRSTFPSVPSPAGTIVPGFLALLASAAAGGIGVVFIVLI
jgi:hypothetical protein